MATATTTTTESYILVRIVFLRCLAFIYGVAFTVAYKQNKALIGDEGITPARNVLDRAQGRGNKVRKHRARLNKDHGNGWFLLSYIETLREVLWDRTDSANHPVTTILWLAADRAKLNPWLDCTALCGLFAAILVFILGSANVPLLLLLFTCQRSLWAVGGEWYAYGWEPLLAELGFHALFMVPLFQLTRTTSEVPLIVVWAMRWFLFRIMMGAGLTKIKGSNHWRDLTAMNYFYETQPVPNLFSKYFHFAPEWWHRFEVLSNHVVELVAPWLLILVPYFRQCRIAGGVIQILFQAVLILSGNLSFLNWLTAVSAIFCFDDELLRPFFPNADTTLSSGSTPSQQVPITRQVASVTSVTFGLLIAGLSLRIIRNFFSGDQTMIGSFDRFRIVNTFGAFGTISEERSELIISSAMEDMDGEWKEYEFPVKPGDPTKRPRWILPYHYRLDWQMWIAAQSGNIYASPWIYRFLIKLLEADSGVLKTLMAHDPWDGAKPKYIRVDRYRYKFNHDDDDDESIYWDREHVQSFYPRRGAATLETLWRKVDRTGT